MAANKLRILYNNLIDNNTAYTTIEASTAAIPVSNLTLDTKGLIWRSSTTTNGVTPTLTTVAVVTTITANITNPSTGNLVGTANINGTSSLANLILCASTAGFVVGYSIVFANSIGGLIAGNTYYISFINNSTSFQVTTTLGGTSPTLSDVYLGTSASSSQVINPSTGLKVASPTITATTVTTNLITCTSTTGFVVGYPIIFGSSVGGLIAGNVYYIAVIANSTQFVVITATKANLVSQFYTNSGVTVQSLNNVKLVALPFTNLTTSAIIRVRGYTGTAAATQTIVDNPTIVPGTSTIFDTGYIAAVPYELSGNWGWGSSGIGVNTFAYGGGTYARVYINAPNTACTSISIEIHDNNPDKYIECSRLIIGDYWTPTYNTQYGLSTTINDSSTNQRTEAGDLVTNRGTKFNKLNFDLGYLTASDRNTLLSIMHGAGLSKPLFVSLFAEDIDTGKERAHQIYGKLSGINAVTHHILDMYTSSLEVEEI